MWRDFSTRRHFFGDFKKFRKFIQKSKKTVDVFFRDRWLAISKQLHWPFEAGQMVNVMMGISRLNKVWDIVYHLLSIDSLFSISAEADLGGGCRGCAPSLRWPTAFLHNWYSAKKCGLSVLVTPFISGASHSKKNPGSAPAVIVLFSKVEFVTLSKFVNSLCLCHIQYPVLPLKFVDHSLKLFAW